MSKTTMNKRRNAPFIFNNELNVNTNDIKNCEDVQRLKNWLVSTQNTVDTISIQISDKTEELKRLNIKDKDSWFHEADKARKKLGIMIRTIQYQISAKNKQLKVKNKQFRDEAEGKNLERLKQERDFWKKLFRKHNPLVYFFFKKLFFSKIKGISESLKSSQTTNIKKS